MPQPTPRPPPADASDGTASAAPSWAAEGAEADPAPGPTGPPTAQMPLFDAHGAAPAAELHARLRRRIKALLARRRPRPPAPDASGLAGSSWPDSFFDADAKPGP